MTYSRACWTPSQTTACLGTPKMRRCMPLQPLRDRLFEELPRREKSRLRRGWPSVREILSLTRTCCSLSCCEREKRTAPRKVDIEN